MNNAPLMPIATAVWLVENTSLSFKQIAEFCKMHEVEIQSIADGEVGKGIVGYNPIISGQLTKEEIDLSSKDHSRPLSINENTVEISDNNTKFKKYEHVLISIKKDSNLNKLISKIKSKLKNKFTTTEDILITRERHRQNLINCVNHLEKFEKKKSAQEFDKAAEDLRLATRHLGMIVGKVDVEELLGSIFNDFCIGK